MSECSQDNKILTNGYACYRKRDGGRGGGVGGEN